MIVNKPRQLRIDLDPEQGFPTAIHLESRRLVIEEGQEVMELPPHITALDPGSDEAKAILGEVTASAISALKTYQDEVQRLASQLLELKAQPTTPE